MNTASQYGGAIYNIQSQLVINSTESHFLHNSAYFGGALYAYAGAITVKHSAAFTSNSAQMLGGAIYFESGAILHLEPYSNLTMSHNHASKYGGAIYHQDAPNSDQCELKPGTFVPHIPQCFLNMRDLNYFSIFFTIISHNNSANEDGSFLYGGLLDRCRMYTTTLSFLTLNLSIPYQFVVQQVLQIDSADSSTNTITSEPYMLCFCETDQVPDCSGMKNIAVYRGQEFTIPLIAYAQGNTIASTQVTARIRRTASLRLNQSLQTLNSYCSNKTYNLYSTEMSEELTLYVDGPCRDTGLATAVVNVTFWPCPDAFNRSSDRCECEERLQTYDVECIIDSEERIYIKRKTADSVLFWMSTLYVNRSYQGLILYETCPPEFCKTEPVEILLDDLDSQCNHHRSGKLCGACAVNYSLLLGNSRCRQDCSNNYLGLLLVFSAAGIVLVIFLTSLRLTVATGLINSIILFANIVQANRSVFFPVDNRNVVTVFVAWMNLDFGFPSCFYNGMDAYAQTWLQFVFPIYIWILISLIILVSRYSIAVSRLIGHNPVAVLATLILMSYTKILKIIIEVYAFVDLDYPNNGKSTVWLKDANVPYLETKHLFLAVVTTLILVFLFLPYTLLLLLSYKLYRFTGRKPFLWLNTIKPLLDSYYAPYNLQTRYWSGFLLLVRCALYVVFSSSSLGGTTMSLLAIAITFTVILVLTIVHAWRSIKIYKNIFVNIIEASVYVNLIILSAASLADANTPALVYSLVGAVFVAMIGIIVHHFHLSYMAKSAIWLKIRGTFKATLTKTKTEAPVPFATGAGISSHDPHKIVSQSVIDLREPMLEK